MYANPPIPDARHGVCYEVWLTKGLVSKNLSKEWFVRSKNPAIKVVAFAAIASVAVMGYLYFNRVEVTAVCRDVRTYMDGTYSATIEHGGLQSKTILTLYKLDRLRNKKVGIIEVNPQYSTADSVLYSGKDVTLQIAKKAHDSKYPGRLELNWGKEKISAAVGCKPPTHGT